MRSEILEKMKEDLVEILTRILFNEKLSNLMIALCRICTMDDERMLIMKINEL